VGKREGITVCVRGEEGHTHADVSCSIKWLGGAAIFKMLPKKSIPPIRFGRISKYASICSQTVDNADDLWMVDCIDGDFSRPAGMSGR
jgi:hypothetical protein